MPSEPKRPELDIPAKKPDIQPEPRPEEIPQDKNPPEKESPPMQLQLAARMSRDSGSMVRSARALRSNTIFRVAVLRDSLHRNVEPRLVWNWSKLD